MRRIVVTGANKGIGRAIVEAILQAHDDTFVWLGSRDEARGEAARADLVRTQSGWADRIAVLGLDVSDDASVEAAAARVASATPHEPTALHGVVNNAGIGLSDATLRATLEVNTFGMRRVCEAFVPLLPEGGRIVNVTSAAGPSFVSECSEARQRFFLDPTVTWPQLQGLLDECLALPDAGAFKAAGFGGGNVYGLSKAAANSYTLMLARRHPTLQINACTPGFIETDMTRGFAQARGKAPADLGMKPPSAGTRAPLHLLFGAVSSPDGEAWYYGSDAERSPLHRYRSPGDPPYTGA